MANWAITNYIIEGPEEDLQKIYDAIKVHDVEPESSEDWEGNILNALGIDWERHETHRQEDGTINCTGYYMRGFIYDKPEFEDGILSFMCEEAWGLTDFRKPLEKHFPNIKIYWQVEEPDDEVYATNDVEGKYFPERYYIDVYMENDICDSGYFSNEEEALNWLSEITEGKINSKEDIDNFNDKHKNGDQYIDFNKYRVEQ